MTFMPAAWKARIARQAQEKWNAEHPDRLVPWEWVEEALLAWRSWKEQQSYAPQAAEEARQRYEEFVCWLPVTLQVEIFPASQGDVE